MRYVWLEEFEREKDLCRAVFQPDLTDDDRAWVRDYLELSGARVPDVDISWINFERGS